MEIFFPNYQRQVSVTIFDKKRKDESRHNDDEFVLTQDQAPECLYVRGMYGMRGLFIKTVSRETPRNVDKMMETHLSVVLVSRCPQLVRYIGEGIMSVIIRNTQKSSEIK